MDDEIRTKPACRREDAEMVLRALRHAGHVAYFAGGCVRDLLLGLPAKDWDVATDAPPARVRKLFPKTQAVGQAFGVILVRQGGSVVEVATFRREGKYYDGRRPSEVHFTTAEEDAKRRDFTINGLFLDPLDNDHVIDFVGGVADLQSRRLRAIGNPAERFAEDHLRLLRAVRFAARFGMEIDDTTADAIARDAPLLKHISPERIADELRLMLTPVTRSAGWRLLWRFRLIDVIYRFLPMPPGAQLINPRSVFLHLAPDRPISFGLALAAGVTCVLGQPPLDRPALLQSVRAMRQALKISNEELDEMQGTLEALPPLLAQDFPRVATLKRFLARPTSTQSRMLLDAMQVVGIHSDRINQLRPALEELSKTEVAPPPLITGDDLTAAGLTPGPKFKRILDTVYDAQLEGAVATKEGALRQALQLARS